VLAAIAHGASCGALWCVRPPRLRGADLRALTRLRSAPPAAPLPSHDTPRPPPDAPPLLIPRVIHQTFRSLEALPPPAVALMATWRARNPGWAARFWSDDECATFVETEFPEYRDAYHALPKDVERADFFRYLVILRHGGVYADVDTECRAPLDTWLLPADALVVGWENEFPSAARAAGRRYVRKRQVLQWVFAGAPGHPALRAVCDHVAAHARAVLSPSPNFDTLERTGPGAFTDAVLAAADAHPPSAAAGGDAWRVRVLPKAVLGAHPRGLDGVSPDDARVAVLHHYLGTWKSVRGWAGGGLLGAAVGALRATGAVAAPAPAAAGFEPALPRDRAAPRFYPVSLLTAPPVSILVPLAGAGERVGGDDAAAGVTAFGAWAPGAPPSVGSSPVDVLLAALDACGDAEGALLDLGAGVGAASAAAAARGRRVVAAEAGPVLAAALRATVAYNGFEGLVDVKEVAVGVRAGVGVACLDATAPAGARDDAPRGYGPGPDPASDYSSSLACARTAPRVEGASLAPDGGRVAAVRVSAPGWEAAALDGLAPLLESATPPPVLMLELDVAALDARDGAGAAPAALARLRALGYASASHAGPACAARWTALARSLRLPALTRRASPGGGRVTASLPAGVHADALAPPPWCALAPAGDDDMLAAARRARRAETLLFLRESGEGVRAALDPDADGDGDALAP